MKRCLKLAPAILVALASGPAFALGEYNDAIESVCSGHSTEMVIPRDILDGNKTISYHPDPTLGRRVIFDDDQHWACKMHKGSMMFGSAVDGWSGTYRILPELNDDGAVIVLSPTTSPVPSY